MVVVKSTTLGRGRWNRIAQKNVKQDFNSFNLTERNNLKITNTFHQKIKSNNRKNETDLFLLNDLGVFKDVKLEKKFLHISLLWSKSD